MNLATLSIQTMEQQYNSKILYKFAPVSTIYYMPETPVKDKRRAACKLDN